MSSIKIRVGCLLKILFSAHFLESVHQLRMEDAEVKSRTFAKEEFSIERDCLEMLHRKPRVSKNVFQAYHKEITEIAQASKQLLLDIIEKKRK